jgi:hypothetical protein
VAKKQVLIRHKATGMFESFDFAEKQEVMEPDDEGTLRPVEKTRKEVFEDLDPKSYDVIDSDKLTHDEQVAAIDRAMGDLRASKAKLEGKAR